MERKPERGIIGQLSLRVLRRLSTRKKSDVEDARTRKEDKYFYRSSITVVIDRIHDHVLHFCNASTHTLARTRIDRRPTTRIYSLCCVPMSTCTWHVPKPIPQQRRKTILRGLDTQLDFFLHVRDILAGNSSVGAGLRRSPEQSRLRSLSGETSTSSPRAPYVSLPSESARPSVIKDLL